MRGRSYQTRRHPQMSPFPVSIERRDLIRTTHKLHRLSNITSATTAPAAADGPSMAQIQQGMYTEVDYRVLTSPYPLYFIPTYKSLGRLPGLSHHTSEQPLDPGEALAANVGRATDARSPH